MKQIPSFPFRAFEIYFGRWKTHYKKTHTEAEYNEAKVQELAQEKWNLLSAADKYPFCSKRLKEIKSQQSSQVRVRRTVCKLSS